MRVAIYIADGTTQLVLTPESDWEKNVVRSIGRGDASARITCGSFYETRGGWIRHGRYLPDEYALANASNDDDSLMIRVAAPKEVP